MKRLLPLVVILSTLATARAAEERFYIGTYTGKSGSEGIYLDTLDSDTGKLGTRKLAVAADSPSFLTLDPGGKFLYACTGAGGGSAGAFAVKPDGTLALLNQQASGAGATHVAVDPTGRNVFIANYSAGSLASFHTGTDGALTPAVSTIQYTGTGPDKSRQEKPHAHSVYTDPAGKFVYSCDLGTDNVWIFKLDPATAKLTAAEPASAKVPPGSGPRHLAFHPNGKYVYVANEMGHTVTAFTQDSKTGALTQFQDITTLPPGQPGAGVTVTVAEIYCHPTGKWLYVTNRGYDSVAVYSIAADGKLTWIQDFPSTVKFPRGFGIDPLGKWLVIAGQDDNKINVLKIDQDTGKLSATDQFTEAGTPVCILFATH